MKSVDVLYRIALHGPLTADDINEMAWPDEPTNDTSQVLLKLWKQGYLERRPREQEARGRNPFEYDIHESD